MKKVSLLLISFMLTLLPSMAKTTVPEKVNEDAPKVFIYHIPDDVVKGGIGVPSSDKKMKKHLMILYQMILQQILPVC